MGEGELPAFQAVFGLTLVVDTGGLWLVLHQLNQFLDDYQRSPINKDTNDNWREVAYIPSGYVKIAIEDGP